MKHALATDRVARVGFVLAIGFAAVPLHLTTPSRMRDRE